MYFIGIISNSKRFKKLQNFLFKSKNKKEYTLININCKSIENLKNIKFDIVVIIDKAECIEENSTELKEICCGINYLVVNSDIDYTENSFKDIKTNIITFGLNHLSTITFSSVTEEKNMISIQRSFKDKYGNIVEVGEYSFNKNNEENKFLYEYLVYFIIEIIYGNLHQS